ncbi:developmental pluripotency-associated protein 2-like [Microtus pennsylvanicus]|uniref:developmental pluripotency-associated protein 2-like n=1 Tax=Microtus pennsylvanicus TaxID=10058 RepID=UPI003F6CEDA3
MVQLKVEVYKRLQQYSYSEQICYIPETSREARLKPIAKKTNKAVIAGPRPQGLKRKREEDEPGEEVLTSERESGIVEVLTSERESGIVEVLTSERKSVFAAWGRITMRASQPRAENCRPLPSKAKAFLPPVTGHRWCVIHGRQLPADKEGWVCLQMHAGQTWVPYSSQRMIPLFILPACVFPSPGLEDNLLCPECAHSNRKMMRNFERDRRTEKKHKQLRENMPP